jgi:hypothetical protein
MPAAITIEKWAKIQCPECGVTDEQITMLLYGDTVSTTHLSCCGYILLDIVVKE